MFIFMDDITYKDIFEKVVNSIYFDIFIRILFFIHNY